MNNTDAPTPGNASFYIRQAAEADLPDILRIERASFGSPWSEGMFRSEFGNRWSRILIAEIPGSDGRMAAAGFMVLWLLLDELHINNVAVMPDARRRGLGRAMMEAALRLAEAGEAALATLEVRRSNAPAIRLYESFGFSMAAVRKAYYEDGEDAFFMTRAFSESGGGPDR